jgi:hypothetical protein
MYTYFNLCVDSQGDHGTFVFEVPELIKHWHTWNQNVWMLLSHEWPIGFQPRNHDVCSFASFLNCTEVFWLQLVAFQYLDPVCKEYKPYIL